MLQVLDWRWLFGLILPVAVGALVLGALRLPDLSTTRPARVDLPSVALAAVGFGGLVLGLSRLGEADGGAARAWGVLAVGAVGLALFVLRQLRLQRVATPDAVATPGFPRP